MEPRPRALEVYQNDNGVPGDKITTDILNTGFYDISLGKDTTLFLHNPNHNTVCDISKWGTENPMSILEAPDLILPMETVKIHIKIAPMTEEQIDENPPDEDMKDSFGGGMVWQACNVTVDDKARSYGWDEYV